jgi:hypothetical protein
MRTLATLRALLVGATLVFFGNAGLGLVAVRCEWPQWRAADFPSFRDRKGMQERFEGHGSGVGQEVS